MRNKKKYFVSLFSKLNLRLSTGRIWASPKINSILAGTRTEDLPLIMSTIELVLRLIESILIKIERGGGERNLIRSQWIQSKSQRDLIGYIPNLDVISLERERERTRMAVFNNILLVGLVSIWFQTSKPPLNSFTSVTNVGDSLLTTSLLGLSRLRFGWCQIEQFN